MSHFVFWIVFNLFVLAMLALDFSVLRRNRSVNFLHALALSVFWVLLAGVFAVLLRHWQGPRSSLEFVTGYLIELSLSVDNLFVFILIFRYFNVDPEHQPRILFWGILGAIAMRTAFILAGVGLIRTFHWVTYPFGLLLLYSGVKLFGHHSEIHPDKNFLLRAVRRAVPVAEDYQGGNFFVRREKFYATPLLVVLLVVETTDLLFAVDSIPAVLAITLNVFIVYTSNIFAILGLRSLYFVLSGAMERFGKLQYGLAAILIFVGAKMMLSRYYEIPNWIALLAVAGILLITALASLVLPRNQPGTRR